MASVLLVIGALMSGAGLYAVYHGYSIIQIEEGWASVISGATLVAGGILTVALGLVLRVLKQVKAGLLDTPARVQPELSIPSSDLAENSAQGAPEPAAIDATFPAALAEPPVAAVEAHRTEPPVEAQSPPPPALASPKAETVPFADEIMTPQIAAAEPQAPPEVAHPLSAVEEPRPADDYKLETPSTTEHDLLPADEHEPRPSYAEPSHSEPPYPEPYNPEPSLPERSRPEPFFPARSYPQPSSPPVTDWLDQAFAELDRDNAPELDYRPATEARTPKPQSSRPQSPKSQSPKSQSPKPPSSHPVEPTAPPPSLEPHPEFEPAVAGPASHHDSAETPSPVTPQPTAEPTPPAAVIGRYESEGTTYVMFADGSIEAQSASGVFRFTSMAELKSYIER